MKGSDEKKEEEEEEGFESNLCYVAGVLQVVLKQLGRSVLEGFGQSGQQHAELGGVELEQSDQHRLGSLRNREDAQDPQQCGQVVYYSVIHYYN